jgi:hypothetical protein
MVKLGVALSLIFCFSMFAADTACLSHIQQGGSIFKGQTLDTYADFDTLQPSDAFRRLEAQLPSTGIAILEVDKTHGIIKGENRAPNSRPFPVDFTIAPIPTGTRVLLKAKMNAGQMIVGGTKTAICELLDLVKIEPPKAPEEALTNDKIVQLAHAGMDDDVIIAKIEEAESQELDVSTAALLKLHENKINKRVIAAMVKRSEQDNKRRRMRAPGDSNDGAAITGVSSQQPCSATSRHITKPEALCLASSNDDVTPKLGMMGHHFCDVAVANLSLTKQTDTEATATVSRRYVNIDPQARYWGGSGTCEGAPTPVVVFFTKADDGWHIESVHSAR